MIRFDEALALIDAAIMPLGQEMIALEQALGRVLAAPLHARNDFPQHPVAMMDGYAVQAEGFLNDVAMRVIGESRAGCRFGGAVSAGEAVRIFTGAPLPEGADLVIMQEYAERTGDIVRFRPGHGPARHISAAGSDFVNGSLLLPAGTWLCPRTLVTAAAADVSMLPVARQPRVAVLASGDELALPGEAHRIADALPESVSLGVSALAERCGAQITQRTIAPDDLPTLITLAGTALAGADLVVTTGGASVGERDFAKAMFADHGLSLVFSTIAIKPGKPVWLGRARGCWVLGLPGNPTSAMVTATLLLRPVLARLQGCPADAMLRWRRMPLAAPLPAIGDRETFVRARWDDAGLTPLENQNSGAQSTLAVADWLIRCPPGQSALAAGAMVPALAF